MAHRGRCAQGAVAAKMVRKPRTLRRDWRIRLAEFAPEHQPRTQRRDVLPRGDQFAIPAAAAPVGVAVYALLVLLLDEHSRSLLPRLLGPVVQRVCGPRVAARLGRMASQPDPSPG